MWVFFRDLTLNISIKYKLKLNGYYIKKIYDNHLVACVIQFSFHYNLPRLWSIWVVDILLTCVMSMFLFLISDNLLPFIFQVDLMDENRRQLFCVLLY